MVTDKKLKRHRLMYILRQPLYLAFVLFFWIKLLSMGYTDIGTIFALIMITLGTLIIVMHDWLSYDKYVDKYYKDNGNE